MRAIVFDDKLEFRTDYPDPERGENEALIRVTHAGICNTDLEITKGYMGFRGILGHEFVGVIEQCDDNNAIGNRVVGEINLGCGVCSFCRNNNSNHCSHRSVIGIKDKNGVFADYITLPLANLHTVPDIISDEEAVFTEPLAAAFEIFEQVNIKSSDRVCVLGDGKLGLLVSQALAASNCDLTVIGHYDEKLAILGKLGIKTSLSASYDEPEFDIVVECTGSCSGINTALNIVRPKGKIILKTTVANKDSFNLNHIVINEISLIGSRCGPFEPAIQAIKSGAVDLLPLISKIYSLDDGLKALKYASEKGVIKVILKMS
jgi:threonine dehydrogenase-like Zn-dependent dehydrogenase